MNVGDTFIIQPITVTLSNIVLKQDETIKIIEVNGHKITFWYSEDQQLYIEPISAIKPII